MRTLCALVLLASAVGATSARAATELEILEKKVQKYAVPVLDVFDKRKGFCVCISDNNAFNKNAAGVLDVAIVLTGDSPPARVRVRCMVMQASSGGDIQLAEQCDNWVPLAK